MEQFDKQPAEAYVIAIEFAGTGKLPEGTSLFSATVQATRYPDLVVDNSVIANTLASISGTQALIKVLGGTHGNDYRITFMVTLSNLDLLEEDVLMEVREL